MIQASDRMRKLLATCAFAALLAVCACSSALSRGGDQAIPSSLIPLDQAKALIASGQVKEIFQPHSGCVVLTLQNGKLLSFEQPYLDWVLEFVDDAGLGDSVSTSIE